MHELCVSKSKKARLFEAGVAMAVFALAFTGVAYAIGISAVTLQQPASIEKGSSKQFKAELKYNNEILGVPVPSQVGLTIEVPKLCAEPSITSYSDKVTVSSVAASDSVSGKASWRFQSSKWISTTSTMKIYVKAKGKTKGTSKSYIGTKPFTSDGDIEYNSYKTFKVTS